MSQAQWEMEGSKERSLGRMSQQNTTNKKFILSNRILGNLRKGLSGAMVARQTSMLLSGGSGFESQLRCVLF